MTFSGPPGPPFAEVAPFAPVVLIDDTPRFDSANSPASSSISTHWLAPASSKDSAFSTTCADAFDEVGLTVTKAKLLELFSPLQAKMVNQIHAVEEVLRRRCDSLEGRVTKGSERLDALIPSVKNALQGVGAACAAGATISSLQQQVQSLKDRVDQEPWRASTAEGKASNAISLEDKTDKTAHLNFLSERERLNSLETSMNLLRKHSDAESAKLTNLAASIRQDCEEKTTTVQENVDALCRHVMVENQELRLKQQALSDTLEQRLSRLIGKLTDMAMLSDERNGCSSRGSSAAPRSGRVAIGSESANASPHRRESFGQFGPETFAAILSNFGMTKPQQDNGRTPSEGRPPASSPGPSFRKIQEPPHVGGWQTSAYACKPLSETTTQQTPSREPGKSGRVSSPIASHRPMMSISSSTGEFSNHARIQAMAAQSQRTSLCSCGSAKDLTLSSGSRLRADGPASSPVMSQFRVGR